jgi:LmbE family N-acetylglucosaminyl deacetylase
MSKVIIISAHPDDETLGAGGTILKHKENGDEVYWLIVTNVFESEGFSKERVLSRKQEIEEVSRLYSFKKVYNLEYPTMKLNDTILFELVNKISHIFQKLEPEIIYVMNRSDAHSDHRIVFDAVMSCTKSFRYPYVKKVLMYECLSETEFAPILPERVFQANYYVDISNFLNKKIEIMKIFDSELGEHPFPRSIKNIEALATFRGATVGVLYAEAFQMIKYIDK